MDVLTQIMLFLVHDPSGLAHMAPIACYTLRRFGSHFTYQLFIDRVQASGPRRWVRTVMQR